VKSHITYIETWEGWVYLATVIDCHTKAVVGWAMADNYKTPLIERAIEMAARNHQLADWAIFHSWVGPKASYLFRGTIRCEACGRKRRAPRGGMRCSTGVPHGRWCQG
jgi:transposase InsO family protein